MTVRRALAVTLFFVLAGTVSGSSSTPTCAPADRATDACVDRCSLGAAGSGRCATDEPVRRTPLREAVMGLLAAIVIFVIPVRFIIGSTRRPEPETHPLDSEPGDRSPRTPTGWAPAGLSGRRLAARLA